MKILLLGPPSEKISRILKKDGHQVLEKESPVDVQFVKEKKIDFAVSYGYRHIIKSDVAGGPGILDRLQAFTSGYLLRVHGHAAACPCGWVLK